MDPQRPALMRQGPNESMVDTTVGTQYWYFRGGLGAVHIVARYKGRGQFDVGAQTPLDVEIFDENRVWVKHKRIAPDAQLAEARDDENLAQREKIMITVSAPRGGIGARGWRLRASRIGRGEL